MKSFWKFWCDAKNNKNASNLLQQVKRELAVGVSEEKVDAYHKGGFVVSFCVDHDVNQWNDFVVEVIAFGQRVGYGWSLSGDINQQVDGWSNESRISGIQSIQWMCDAQL